MSPDPVVVLEVTSKCNLECSFCYNVWKDPGKAVPPELDTVGFQRVIERLDQLRPVSVTLTGGEPLLREDLSQLAGMISSKGLPVGVATNGILLTPELAGTLVSSGVSWFDISMPSTDQCTTRRLTGRDIEAETRRGLMAVVGSGARLTISHIITSINFGETADMVRTACAFSAEAVALNRFVPTGEGSRNRHLKPSLSQLHHSLQAASKAALETGMTVYTGIPVEDCMLPNGNYPGVRFGGCVCGSGKWVIGPDGGLRTCEQSPTVIGYLTETDFRRLAEDISTLEFRRSWRFRHCWDCPSFQGCGGGCRFL